MHFQPMIEKIFLLLVDRALVTRKTFPSKTLATIGCNLYWHIPSSMASLILLGTKNYPILLVQRPLIFINRISIIFLILRMFFVIWLSLSFTSNKFLTFSEKSSSYRTILNAKKHFLLFNAVLPMDLNRSSRWVGGFRLFFLLWLMSIESITS